MCKDEIAYISDIANNHIRNSKFGYGHSKTVTNAKKVIRCGLVTWEGTSMKSGEVGERGSKSCCRGCLGYLQAALFLITAVWGTTMNLLFPLYPQLSSIIRRDLGCLREHRWDPWELPS